ncbi:tRNA (adenosine(37)-N6)-threonylcarbamoyltransferase complex dimerization subunit type 1 TsaB [Aureispira sp. CCB-QB1]|uniref:tRNA (adenosine(37)-N6)-threonylcarbamoyltransferase complex dimerization subunit type 1 TsaB n=1 Tax=Aureispira sp. CCB-QB1 TaxID=1313421 RepID=UPI00069806A2|nr:tRNA (adenosine(37)-N6)-threonylcarbamoyltransferase complex dimerization subunit type 1 TsaB [Aureispira sp. CCB-QB1]
MATKILTIETATRSCSVCLTKDGQPWIIRETNSQAGHAEKLTLFIEEVMQTANVTLKDLDAIAVSQGPGSYTGLRIGISTAKGLCYALDKPMLAIDTLQALAFGAIQQYNNPKAAYVALMDARRMDAYVGVYDVNCKCIKTPYFATLEPNSFDELLEYSEIDEVVLVGDAVAKYQENCQTNPLKISTVQLPSSKYLAQLAYEAYQQQKTVDVAYFEPFYLKKPNITKPKPKF